MSQVEVDKVIPQSGTTLTIGDSGDTVTIPSGATLAIAGSVSGFTSAGIDDNATSVAITINSSEQVGIGTASPSQLLHVYSTGNDIARIETNQTEGRLSLKDATGNAILKFRNDYRFTNSSGELARLNSSGNFGIGTSAPATTLHIAGGIPKFRIQDTDVTSQAFDIRGAGADIHFDLDPNNAVANGDLKFDIDGSNKMIVRSSGNVGIGTSSPSQLLHLKSTTNEKPNILIETENAGANGGRLDFLHKSSSPADGDLLGDITFGGYSDSGTPPSDFARYVMIKAFAEDVSNNAEKGRLTFSIHSGASNENNLDVLTLNGTKVGIGTTNPDSPLDILTSGNSGLEVNAGTSSAHRIYLGNTGGTSVVGTLSNHDFGLITNGSERMRITSAGKVLVNTTGEYAGTGAEMTVNDGIDVGTTSTANGGFVSFIGDGVGRIGEVGSKVSGYSTMPNIEFHADNVSGGSQAGHIEFNTRFISGSRSEAMRITKNGHLLLGTTTETARLCIASTTTAGTDPLVVFFDGSGTTCGSIDLNASGNTVAYVTSSDYRLKENVSYDFDATSRLKQLKPARFNFIADADTTVDGFIAHEVSDIVPEAVTKNKDAVKVWKDNEELPDGVSVGDNKLDENGNTIPDYQGIDQSKLVPLLVKTIQELEARITTLENT